MVVIATLLIFKIISPEINYLTLEIVILVVIVALLNFVKFLAFTLGKLIFKLCFCCTTFCYSPVYCPLFRMLIYGCFIVATPL